ncbi:MAG: hypothetical protein PHI73_02440 [Patescibacteria group bacterium]|nr:hypothetical protein [Patescibacteria group bacterium]
MPRNFEEKLYIFYQDQRYLLRIVLLILPFILALETRYCHSAFLGTTLFVLYLTLNAFVLARIYKSLPISFVIRLVIGLLSTLFFIGSGAAIATLVYTLDFWALLAILLIPNLVFVILHRKYSLGRTPIMPEEPRKENRRSSSLPIWIRLAIPTLFIAAFVMVFSSRTGKFITSPWEALPSFYAPVVFLLSLILVLIFFTKTSKKVILFLIIVFSFLVHSYLMVVYEGGFGGDRWRHMSYEEQIIDERPIPPTLISEQGTEMKKIGPVSVPAVMVDSRIGYSYTWGVMATIGKLTHLNTLALDIWFFPTLWIILMPLLFFTIGKLLFDSRPWQYLLAFLPVVFDVFQVGGSLTVPLSISLLLFSGFSVIMILYLKKEIRSILPVVILSPLFIFQYPVATVFFGSLLIIGLIVNSQKSLKNKIFLLLSMFAMIFVVLVAVDLYGQMSVIVWDRLKSVSVVIAGIWKWFIATAFGISSGLASDISKNAQTAVTQFILWVLVIIGLGKLSSLQNSTVKTVLKVLSWLLLFALFINLFATQFMDGLRLVTGRMDLFIVFFSLPFIVLGVQSFLERAGFSRTALMLASLIISLVLLQQYTRAPILKTVTTDEIKAADHIYSQYLKDKPNPCVLAEEWQLLALQEASRNRIQGGGFPVSRDFIQSEKDKIFYGLINNPQKNYSEVFDAFDLTGANQCFFLFEKRFSGDATIIDKLHAVFGASEKLGDVYVFKIKKPD